MDTQTRQRQHEREENRNSDVIDIIC